MNRSSLARGVTLIEIMMSLLIVSIGVMALFNLGDLFAPLDSVDQREERRQRAENIWIALTQIGIDISEADSCLIEADRHSIELQPLAIEYRFADGSITRIDLADGSSAIALDEIAEFRAESDEHGVVTIHLRPQEMPDSSFVKRASASAEQTR